MKNLSNKIVFSCLVLALIVGSYYVGVAEGMAKAFKLIALEAPTMLQVELTPRAKAILASNGELMKLALTPESLEKLLKGYTKSAELKGGLGPEGIGRNLTLWKN
jgi:hypothetical protein